MSDSALMFDPVPGLRLATAAAGIRYTHRDDLALFEFVDGTQCAAVFTRNAFRAAPVMVAERHLAARAPRFLLINAGNANAGTGTRGLADAEAACAALAELAGEDPRAVLPFSTGVIGEPLPVARIRAALPGLLAGLDERAWPAAARAILTTDTRAKLVSRRFQVAGRTAALTGIAKGSGMIRPDMATMLAFLATDAAVEPSLLRRCLAEAVDRSFNAITVDGDTSTNDACVLAATGRLGGPAIADPGSADYRALADAVTEVCEALAEAIIRDGEGATKLVTLVIEEAADQDEARRVADAIAHSPLVKTALFASDPNWGRILAAVGRAGLSGLAIAAVRIWLGEVLIVTDGGRAPDYTEEAGRAVMAAPEILIRVALGRGRVTTRVLTCDLSYDYVRINAEYRS
ncbi:bifunctional glutamate N-acetyltransferase/amino-acid acetyltransferase ArgJ [Thioalkalicoccus limnaeus]|uniref:Arginine biosynthesis bifunctional protein ArgJ n=1 Tax=Thioalkalicoccus limnaeus TaxID=120681 RepID=A0ABV4BEN3_9GAMM